jgi:hypothetical protein
VTPTPTSTPAFTPTPAPTPTPTPPPLKTSDVPAGRPWLLIGALALVMSGGAIAAGRKRSAA